MRRSFRILSFTCLLGSIIAQSACSDEENYSMVESNSSQAEGIKEYPYHIPLNEALASLENFLSSSANRSRAEDDDREIEEIYAVEYKEPSTRSMEIGVNCKDLLYVVNYKQNRGFSVLAADKRISEEIIAITDMGKLPKESIDYSYNVLNGQASLDVLYPLSGDGFYSMDEYPGEIFMNPNTASLYVEEENDTLVGNFSYDRIGDEIEEGNPTRLGSMNPVENDTPINVVASLCISYAVEEVKWQKVSIDGTIVDWPPTLPAYPLTHSDTISTNWVDSIVVPPILSNYEDWNQSSPFNDYYPKRRLAILFGHKRKAPAGCFPLAISKIMTHFMRPINYFYNGYQINWNGLRTGSKYSIDANSATSLLYSISEGCNSWYFYQGTFTFPSKATQFMKFIGFNEARSYDYRDSRVCDMLDNGYPLIVYAMPGINVFHSHAWNIDGYKYKSRSKTINFYSNRILVESQQVNENNWFYRI